MKRTRSIRARLLLGAALMLVAFVAAAGLAVQRAHADSVRAAHFAQLQSTIYLLLAEAELDAAGALVMPPSFPEPRLSVPGSGLYAQVVNSQRGEDWKSASTVGISPPFQRASPIGQWRYDTLEGTGSAFLAVTYAVHWAGRTAQAPLVLSVLEDKAEFDRELRVFARTLWTWLGGAAVLLLLSQTVLLEWGLAPLARVANEIRRIEDGEQTEVQGRYPTEIAALTDNLNTLIRQERVRQGRYKEALSFLAHSLKTPLAVLRTALNEPAQLPALVAQQVTRMDDIVQHQLGRAAASGAARFAPYLTLATGPEPHPRFAGEGLCRQAACFHHRLPRGLELAHRRGRCVRDARQRDGQRGQVGEAPGCGASLARSPAIDDPHRGRRPGIRRHAVPSCSFTCAGTRRCPATASAWRWSTTWWPATTAS